MKYVLKLSVLLLVVLHYQSCAKIDHGDTPAGSAASAPTGGLGTPSSDCDGDGLTDDEEMALGTNPAKADTDGDGLSDYEEVRIYGTNPLMADTDGDGLTDGAEVHTFHTVPTMRDTDGGGESDGDEVSRGGNPLLNSDDRSPAVVLTCHI